MAEKIVKDLWTGEHIIYETDNGTTYINSKASVFKKAKGSSEAPVRPQEEHTPVVSSLDLEPTSARDLGRGLFWSALSFIFFCAVFGLIIIGGIFLFILGINWLASIL